MISIIIESINKLIKRKNHQFFTSTDTSSISLTLSPPPLPPPTLPLGLHPPPRDLTDTIFRCPILISADVAAVMGAESDIGGGKKGQK